MGAITLSPQYITDGQGNRVSVVLSVAEFQKLLELLEELEDIRLYDEVKSRNEERIPLTELTEKQKELVRRGSEQIDRGEVVPDSVVRAKARQILGKTG